MSCECDSIAEELFDFRWRRLWMLVSNPFAGNVATEFVQFQRNREPFLARHLPVTCDLLFECRLRCHGFSLVRAHSAVNACSMLCSTAGVNPPLPTRTTPESIRGWAAAFNLRISELEERYF